MYIQQAFAYYIEASKISKSEFRRIRLVSIYVFLTGFVYFEPSFAEIFFVLTILFLLLSIKLYKRIILKFEKRISLKFEKRISLKFNKRIAFTTIILIISEIVSLFRGNLFGYLDLQSILRFTLIDFYLILLFLIFGSVIKQIKNQELLIHSAMKWWSIAAFINILGCFMAILIGQTDFLGVNLISFGIRFQGFFKDPNVLGPFLTIPALYWFDKYLKNYKKNWLYLVISLFIMAGIVLSFSRAAWLNIFFSVLILLFLNFKKINLRKYFRIFVFLFVIFILLIFILQTNITILGFNLSDFFINRLGLQSYDQDRFEAQRTFIKGLENAPLFGVGPGNYEQLSEGYATHSLYFRTLGEKGIFGLSVLAFLVIISLKNFWKIRKEYAFLLAGFIGNLINSIFIDSWHWRHLWILFVFGFALQKVSSKRNKV